MTSTATPVDSAQGTVQDTPTLPSATQSQKKRFTVNCQKTLWHYVANNMDYTGATTRQIMAGDESQTTPLPINCIRKDYGWQNIPYTNLCSAWQDNKMFPALAQSSRCRVLSLGYKAHHFTTLQENLVPRSGSTVLENAFESKPILMLYKAEPYMNAGYHGLDDPQNFKVLMQTKRTLANCNGFMTRSDPKSQIDGMLPRVYEYFQTQTGYDIPGDQKWSFFSPYDTDDISYFCEGNSFGHTWTDPSPAWWPTGRAFAVPWQCANNEEASTWDQFRKLAYFPSSRREALDFDYLNWQYIRRANEGGQANNDETILKVDSLYTPQYHAIKLNPIYGPSGPINTMACIQITYYATYEFEVENVTNNIFIRFTEHNHGNQFSYSFYDKIENKQSLFNQHTTFELPSFVPYIPGRDDSDDGEIDNTDGLLPVTRVRELPIDVDTDDPMVYM